MTDQTDTRPARSPAVRPAEPVDLTALNFFPAFSPPRSGGEMRYGHFYTRLSRLGFRVRMVSPTYPFVESESVEHTPLCTEYRVPKTMTHHRLHQVMGRLLNQAECSALVVAMALGRHADFLARARESIAQSRIVILDYPLPLGPLRLNRRGRERPFLVYNSYNVESVLLRDTLPGLAGRALARWTARHEKTLCRHADVVFACSHDDADRMATLYGIDPTKIYIVPNGVDTASVPAADPADEDAARAARASLGLDPDRPMALFLGSQHPPNIEAARFLIDRVAPQLPRVQFVVAGSVCPALASASALAGAGAPNARVHGPFDDAEKARLLRAATVAVNPVLRGSGTNLKMLEFFASGLPVVATPTGARGLSVEDDRHVCLADEETFAARVEELIQDPSRRVRIGQAARRLAVDRYDWDRICEDAAEILHHKTHRRVLVLSEFPATPASFGGRVRIRHLYEALGREANVTVLTQTSDPRFRRHAIAPGVEEINVPEGRLKRWGKKVFAGLLGVGGDDVVAYLTIRRDRAMRRAYRRESRFAQIVILSHPYTVPLVRGRNGPSVAYESHNVELHLKRQIYGAGFLSRRVLAQVRRCESEAIRRSRFVTSCSEENNRLFGDLYPGICPPEKLVLSPNGVDCANHVAYSRQEKRALRARAGLGDAPLAIFLGSGHPPNVQALRYIVENLAPAHRDVLFAVVGGACWPVRFEPRPPNVLLMFEQDEVVKNRLLALSDIALNPLIWGSGTSLKVLDFLAAGTAVVATEKGARGVAIQNGLNGIVCGIEEIGDEVERLARNPVLCAEMGARGRELALRCYDWSVVSREFVAVVLDHIAPALAAS